jgi:hypothetical protein
LFLAVFLLLNHWVARAYVRFTRQPYVYEANRRGFEAAMDEISFLVLGDSHTLSSVFTPKIPGAFNFSSHGETYILTYFKMRQYLRNNQLDLDVVVMPVSLHTFAGSRMQHIDNHDLAFWAQFVDFIELGIQSGRLEHFIKERIKSEFAHLGGLEEIFEVVHHSKFWLSDRLEAGFLYYSERFSDLDEDKIIKMAGNKADYHFEGVEYVDPLIVKYFNRLLDLLEEEGVQMVFVIFPTSTEYQNAVAEYVQIEDHMAKMESLLIDRENVLILDYHDLFTDRYDVFIDADHLNTDGAKILTSVLLADLKENGITWEAELQP